LVDVVRKIKLFGFSCVDLPLNSSCIRSSGEKVENIWRPSVLRNKQNYDFNIVQFENDKIDNEHVT